MQRKRVLIRGAGSMWGRETALRLVKKGHHVIAGVEGMEEAFGLALTQ